MRSVTAAVMAMACVLVGSAGIATAAPKNYCDELKGANTGRLCQIQLSDAGYNLNISFPIEYPDYDGVGDYITKKRDEFLNVAKSSAPRDQPYQLSVTPTSYGSALPPRGTEAVVFTVKENIGAGPKTTFKSFNWDQTYRKAIIWTAAPDDKKNTPLWRVDDPLKTVGPIVQSELQRQVAPPVSQVPVVPPVGQTPTTTATSPVGQVPVVPPVGQTPTTTAPTSTAPTTSPVSPNPTTPTTPLPPPVAVAPAALYDPANYQNFAVTNDGVIFFFDQGQMVPATAGAPQVLVPRSAIDAMIA